MITETPDLRIIDDELWNAAARGRVPCVRTGPTYQSGIGGGRSSCSRDQWLAAAAAAVSRRFRRTSFGCSAARNRGTAVCCNMVTIRRANLEGAVLNALEHHLMDPEAVRIFCEEYAAERNRLRAKAEAGCRGLARVAAGHRRSQEARGRDHRRSAGGTVQGRMIGLDVRRTHFGTVSVGRPGPEAGLLTPQHGHDLSNPLQPPDPRPVGARGRRGGQGGAPGSCEEDRADPGKGR